MKPKLIIVTGNPLKFRELSASLGEFFDCEQRKLDGYEIQGSPQEILRHKLARAYEAFKEPVLVDDTSLHLAALNGFPGPYIRGFFECMTPYEMGTRFADTRIKVTCRLGVCRTPDDIVIAEGTIHGTVIAPKDNDHKGTEFDLFVIVDGTDRPMIEFPPLEKNKFSHRGQALQNLIQKVKNSEN